MTKKEVKINNSCCVAVNIINNDVQFLIHGELASIVAATSTLQRKIIELMMQEWGYSEDEAWQTFNLANAYADANIAVSDADEEEDDDEDE